MKNSFDVIVIGVGGMGSATCYELAKRGQKVLGIEQFDIPHNYGSSHGNTRIIRKAYFEGPAYVPLLNRAYDLWYGLEGKTGKQVFYKTGSVDIGLPESSVYSGSIASCMAHNLDHEIMTGKELNERFPGYSVPEDYMANFQPDGGFLTPEQCIVSFVEEAQKLGATIHGREEVLDCKSTNYGVNVTTKKETYSAHRLIFTAGAWNSKLLPILNGLAVPERQVLAWLQPDDVNLFNKENFPVFVLDHKGENWYGFPIHEIPGFKFGKFGHLEERGTPDEIRKEPNEADEIALRALSSEIFPKGNGPTMALKTCMFTNTPDSHFIIDRHPNYSNVIIAAGFSGHGFKFASVIGEIMAELASEGRSRHDIEMFQLGRFQNI